jgi:hypothetical protein
VVFAHGDEEDQEYSGVGEVVLRLAVTEAMVMAPVLFDL